MQAICIICLSNLARPRHPDQQRLSIASGPKLSDGSKMSWWPLSRLSLSSPSVTCKPKPTPNSLPQNKLQPLMSRRALRPWLVRGGEMEGKAEENWVKCPTETWGAAVLPSAIYLTAAKTDSKSSPDPLLCHRREPSRRVQSCRMPARSSIEPCRMVPNMHTADISPSSLRRRGTQITWLLTPRHAAASTCTVHVQANQNLFSTFFALTSHSA
jgi:hypothetical protein